MGDPPTCLECGGKWGPPAGSWCAVCRAYVRIGVLLKDRSLPVTWEAALVQRLRQLVDVALQAAAIPVSEETSQAREGRAGSPGAASEEKAEEAAKKGEDRSRSRKRRHRSRSRKRTNRSRKSRSRARDYKRRTDRTLAFSTGQVVLPKVSLLDPLRDPLVLAKPLRLSSCPRLMAPGR